MEVMLKNVMEDLVKEEFNHIAKELGCCTCERCKSDILAYALNQLPPKYVVSEKGVLFSKMAQFDTGFKMEVVKHLAEGARKVNANPRHTEKEAKKG